VSAVVEWGVLLSIGAFAGDQLGWSTDTLLALGWLFIAAYLLAPLVGLAESVISDWWGDA
jgi:hypothetical protein